MNGVFETRTLWYLNRGTGLVCLLLLSGVLVLGVLTRSAVALPGLPRFVTSGLHRSVSMLAVAFLALHVVTAVADPYALTSVTDVLVPFGAGYRPLWVGLGTVALDLLLALVVTSLLRHRLSDALWRAVHWLAYLCWPVAVAHGLGSGTDSAQPWSVAVTATSGVLVLVTVVWRIGSDRFRSDQLVTR